MTKKQINERNEWNNIQSGNELGASTRKTVEGEEQRGPANADRKMIWRPLTAHEKMY